MDAQRIYELRIRATNTVGDLLDECKRLGIRYLDLELESGPQVSILLEALEQAGCRVVSVARPSYQTTAVYFRAPEALFQEGPMDERSSMGTLPLPTEGT